MIYDSTELEEVQMRLQIIYWRDIPAQCILRSGRAKHSVPLHERFEKAIDRCAMVTGLSGSDEYLEQWRRTQQEWNGADNINEATEQIREQIETRYPKTKLNQLIQQDGFETNRKEQSP